MQHGENVNLLFAQLYILRPFFCSVSKKGTFYSALELSVRNPADSSAKVTVCNLNCYSVYELKLLVTLVQKKLLEMYGISTDMGSVLIKSIELNKTIRLPVLAAALHLSISAMMTSACRN